MSPRVAGAALAVLAAVMLVASVAGIPAGWWSGHPIRNGEAMHKKDIDVSMLSATGCNTGGDGKCEPIDRELDTTFVAVRYVELGASGILILACLLLAGVTLAGSERRKPIGKLVCTAAITCAGIAGGLLFVPKMKAAGIELPISPIGLGIFFGGIVFALVGSVFAMRPTPKLELQPPRQSFAPALAPPPTAQPVDVLAMLQPDVRPPLPSRPPPSPGGQLAGPAGPLAPPMFGSAPYAVPLAPAPPEPAPTNLPPTPFPAPPAPFSARPGGPPLATPPVPDARPRSASGAPPLPGPDRTKSSSPMPAIPGDRFKAAGTAPALPAIDRSKATSAAPPPRPTSIGPAMADARTKAASIAPLAADLRPKGPSIPPPMADPRTKPASVPPPMGPIPSTVAGLMPPPQTKLPPLRTRGPSVPPPGVKKPTTVSAIVPPPLVSRMLPMRADTDPSEQLETRDNAPAATVGRPQTDVSIGDSTDAAVVLSDSAAAEESTDVGSVPIDPRDSASEIQTSMQRKLTASELVRTVARESQSEIETIAREKVDLSIGDSTSPAILAEAGLRSAKEIQDLGEAPTMPARIGISTASQSLPPPKQAEVPASGPAPACPQCEAPMAWVEEHLRFYCKSCRMYF